MTPVRPLAAFCVALALTPALRAQERSDTTALPDIVVTATRYPVSADSLGVSVTVLHGDRLRAQGVRTVSEALRQVPGAQVVQGGGFGAQTSVFLRGGESDYVKVLVDGVPANQPGGAYDYANLTTDNIERIEVVRGPASVLYGSDAIAGVVQIVTRTGEGRLRASVAGEGGTYGSTRWEAEAAGGAGAVGVSGAVSHRSSDGVYPFNSEHRNTTASGRAAAGLGARTRLAVSGRHSDATFHFPTDFTGAPVDRNQRNGERATSLALDLSHQWSPTLEGQLLVGRYAADHDFFNAPDTADDPTPFGHTRTDTRRWTVESRALVRAAPELRLLAGGALDEERQRDHTRAAPGEPFEPAGPGLGRTNWGVYLQAAGRPVPELQITAGGRLDRNERFGSFWTYRASALGFAGHATRLRASVGTGFKEPSFFDNFASGFATGNPDLEPERSFSVEAGVTQEITALRATVSLTGFAQRFRDLIQFTFAPPSPGAPNFFNVAAANARGLEVSVQVRGPGGVEFDGAYTRLDTEVTDAGFDSGADATFVDGQSLLRRPADLLTLRAQSSPARRVRGGLVLTVVGAREDLRFAPFPEPTRRPRLPAYATLDLSGGLTLLPSRGAAPGLDLTVRVANLFDATYEQAAGFRSPGRTILVGGAAHVR